MKHVLVEDVHLDSSTMVLVILVLVVVFLTMVIGLLEDVCKVTKLLCSHI